MILRSIYSAISFKIIDVIRIIEDTRICTNKLFLAKTSMAI
jgi:hypothetical protein